MTIQPPAVVAAFDLDGTLTEGGSVFPWLCHLCGRATTYRAAVRLIVPLSIGAIRSGYRADAAKERLFQRLLAGRELTEVTTSSREFILEHLQHEAKQPVLDRLAWHQRQGHEVVIVSASPQIYVDVITEVLGADGGLGTRLAVDPLGRLTGGYLGKNCRGSEKMRRLDEWIAARDFPEPPEIYAYGNSRGDRRMLNGAAHPFNAGKLGPFGALRKYPRVPADGAQ